MKFTLLGFACVLLWIVGAFVAHLTSGWVHVPLAVGTVLIAIGIVVSGEGRNKGMD